MATFCEENSSSQRPFGGVMHESEGDDPVMNHLSQVVNSWKTAFEAGTVNPNAYVKFLDFDRDLIEALISQPACRSVRIYPGFDEGGKLTVCMVANTEGEADQEKSVELFGDRGIKIICCPKNGFSAFLETLFI